MHYLMKCNWWLYLINESDNGNNNKQSKQMTKQTEYLGRSKKRDSKNGTERIVSSFSPF